MDKNVLLFDALRALSACGDIEPDMAPRANLSRIVVDLTFEVCPHLARELVEVLLVNGPNGLDDFLDDHSGEFGVEVSE